MIETLSVLCQTIIALSHRWDGLCGWLPTATHMMMTETHGIVLSIQHHHIAAQGQHAWMTSITPTQTKAVSPVDEWLTNSLLMYGLYDQSMDESQHSHSDIDCKCWHSALIEWKLNGGLNLEQLRLSCCLSHFYLVLKVKHFAILCTEPPDRFVNLSLEMATLDP
jgi:hypothetical protein